MYKNVLRLMLLGVLIILCVWQTIMLWLGDMSGHNFFADQVTTYEMSYVKPKQVWSNINGSIYRIESNIEKEKLIEEVVKELRVNKPTIDLSPKEKYSNLLYETKGIIYEFGTSLTLDEIIGQSLKNLHTKYTPVPIKEVYVDLSYSSAYKIYVYLIDEEAKVKQKLTLSSRLQSETNIVDLYTSQEDDKEYELYQGSITNSNDKDFFVGNSIYSQKDSSQSIKGQAIRLVPIIEDLESDALENYVNDLFKNPSYKNSNLIEDGIAFSDNLNISVKYHNVGTLEFQKTLLNSEGKLTDVERMNKVNLFIESSHAIPESLKEGLYLDEVVFNEKTKEWCYRYGYRHSDGQIVLLDENLKRKLDVEAFVEINILHGEITGGKWIMLELEELHYPIIVKMDSAKALEMIYENTGLTDLEAFKLNSLECAYVIDKINERADFEWIGVYQNKIIRTIEKIDNE